MIVKLYHFSIQETSNSGLFLDFGVLYCFNSTCITLVALSVTAFLAFLFVNFAVIFSNERQGNGSKFGNKLNAF